AWRPYPVEAGRNHPLSPVEIAGYCSIPRAGPESFPLDGARRLARDVVDDTVDALDLVYDAGRGAAEELHVVVVEVRCHAVDRSNGTQSADIVIGAVVTHYTHRLDGQKYCECLPDRVVKPRLANLVQIDRVGLTQDFEFLTRHRTRAAYG